jgi:hypothetical protein
MPISQTIELHAIHMQLGIVDLQDWGVYKGWQQRAAWLAVPLQSSTPTAALFAAPWSPVDAAPCGSSLQRRVAAAAPVFLPAECMAGSRAASAAIDGMDVISMCQSQRWAPAADHCSFRPKLLALGCCGYR